MKVKFLIIIICFSAIISFIIIVNGTNNNLNEQEMLKIGEEKYLEFLWMVKGAFENNKIIVNGKELPENKKVFTCTFQGDNKDCLGENFEEAFHNLFSKNLSYEKVYCDGTTYCWFYQEDQKFYFSYNYYCSENNDEENYQLEIKSYNKNEIVYKITSLSTKTFLTKFLTLTREDNSWKISKVFYRDKCMLDYYIS